MKTLSVIGTRPQFVKYAPLAQKLRNNFDEVLVHTGQHYDYNLDKIFFDELNLPKPDYELGIGSGTHAYQTAMMLLALEPILEREEPNIVLVYGDTNSTLAGALAATKLQIPVAHIEAGLRSFDRKMPEETNRVLTDHCATLFFCPTQTAIENLTHEGIYRNVAHTGDVMVESLNLFKPFAERSKVLKQHNLKTKSYRLATVHRPENTDSIINLTMIMDAFADLGKVVLPCHPRTEKMLKHFELWDDVKAAVTVIEPVGYVDMLALEMHAKTILTDSGGIQKEAFLLGVPCITLRRNTEWVETLERGWNILVGANREQIIECTHYHKPHRLKAHPFGEHASDNIVKELQTWWNS